MALTVEFGVVKVNKYASRESGDTVEIVERPGGGLSAVLVDGQGSGTGAKALSLMLSARIVGLLKEGVRDGAVARAAHDILRVARAGKVSAALEILSVDLAHDAVLLTRNSSVPAVVMSPEGTLLFSSKQGPIGTVPFSRPEILRWPLEPNLTIWVVSDGVASAGRKYGESLFDLASECDRVAERWEVANDRAAALLERAVAADRGRPADDMSIVVLTVRAHPTGDGPRRMQVTLPIHSGTTPTQKGD